MDVVPVGICGAEMRAGTQGMGGAAGQHLRGVSDTREVGVSKAECECEGESDDASVMDGVDLLNGSAGRVVILSNAQKSDWRRDE